MSAVDPRIDRQFTYESVNEYYTWKTAKFPEESAIELPSEIFQTSAELLSHLQTIASDYDISIPDCSKTKYTWVEYIEYVDNPVAAWKFREYVFACAMIFIGSYVKHPRQNVSFGPHSRIAPYDFSMTDTKFTVIGSAELTSDIDVTIQGEHSSFIISVLEDLFLQLNDSGIPIRCWDLEFYGDFRLLKTIYINFSKFKNSQKLVLLKYGLTSYFRSTNQVDPAAQPLLSPLAQSIVRLILNRVCAKKSVDDISQIVYDFWIREAPNGELQRESFYKSLNHVESDCKILKNNMVPNTRNTRKLISNNEKIQLDGYDPGELAFSLFSNLAMGNIHRPESYILPSTAVHVVEFEQKQKNGFHNELPLSWFSSNVRIGIDSVGFLLSALEQLGYLEHYHPDTVTCSKKGIKYFGRLVRALVQSGVLSNTSRFVDISKKLNIFRSSKPALLPQPATTCDENIHQLLAEIQLKIPQNSARRTLKRSYGRRNLVEKLPQ